MLLTFSLTQIFFFFDEMGAKNPNKSIGVSPQSQLCQYQQAESAFVKKKKQLTLHLVNNI